MFFIFITLLTYIFLQFSMSLFLQLLILFVCFLFSNVLLGINPYNLKLYIFRALAILLMLLLIYYSTIDPLYPTSLLIPLCVDEIHYAHDFDAKPLDIRNKRTTFLFLDLLDKDLVKFLELLDQKDNYWVSFRIYRTLNDYRVQDKLHIFLDDPILLNSGSSHQLLSKFINNHVKLLVEAYYLDETIFTSKQSIIVVDYIKIVLK